MRCQQRLTSHIGDWSLVTCDSPDTRDNDAVTTRDRGEGRLEAGPGVTAVH